MIESSSVLRAEWWIRRNNTACMRAVRNGREYSNRRNKIGTPTREEKDSIVDVPVAWLRSVRMSALRSYLPFNAFASCEIRS